MKKKNTNVNIIIIIALLYLITFSFVSIINTQRKSAYNMLLKQAKISGNSIEKKMYEFEDELRYIVSTTNFYSMLLDENLNNDLEIQLKRFYSKYQNMITSIEIFFGDNERTLLRDDNNYFTYSQKKLDDIYILSDEDRISLDTSSSYYLYPIRYQGEIVANIKIFFSQSFGIGETLKKYYSGKKSWNWFINDSGEILSIIYSEKNIEKSQFIFGKKEVILSNINDNLQGKMRHTVQVLKSDNSKRNIGLLSAYYPIQFFHNTYAVIFSVDEKYLYKSVQNKTLLIIVGFMVILYIVIRSFLSIISDRKQAEKKIREESNNFRSVYFNNINAIAIIKDSKFIDCNDKLVSLLKGKNKESILQKSPRFFSPKYQVDGSLSDEKENRMIEIAIKKGFNNFEWIHKKSDSKEFPSAISLTKITKNNESVLHCMWKDLTEEKLLINNLRNANKIIKITNHKLEEAVEHAQLMASEANMANKAKSEFLANMSHELRTPLNSLLILANYLIKNKKNHLDEKEIEFAKIIHKNGSDLLELINEILDISKIEAGGILIQLAEINLEEIEKLILNTFKIQAEEKGLNFEINISNINRKQFLSDEVKLMQIMKNLISNALKFTEKGSIRIDVKTPICGIYSKSEKLIADEYISISVSDTGIGIPKSKHKLVFKAFQQADGSTTRKYGGTGLGLAISLRLTKLLGGKLIMESQEDKGSNFTIILPLTNNTKKINRQDVEYFEESKNDSIEMISKEKSGKPIYDSSTLKDRRVLIVEDNMRNVFALLAILDELDINSVCATNGEEALKILDDDVEFDLVLMDIMMPIMNGYETIKSIRKNDRLKHLKIITLTAKTTNEDYQQCMDVGANGYISKPIIVDDLIKQMIELI